MRILIIILYFILIITAACASGSEYLDEYKKSDINTNCSKFVDIIKGNATVSDYEKQTMIDTELSGELNSSFIYVDLAECIKIALMNNYEIKIEDASVLEAFWLKKNAQFQLLPDFYYEYTIMNLVGKYLVGGIVATNTSEVPIQSTFIFEWSTVNQGKYFFYLAEMRNLLKNRKFNLEFTKDEILKNTVLAYYDVLEKKMEMEVQKVNMCDRMEQLNYTKARFNAGIGTLYDVKRAEAEAAGARQEYTATINSLRLNQAALANIIGVDVFDALYPFEFQVDQRVLVNPDIDIDVLYEQALESREDIKAKKAEIDVYRAQRSANYTDIIPDVTVSYQNGLVGTKRVGLSGNNSLTLDVRMHLGKNLLMGTITQLKADSAAVKQKKLELINLKRQIKENILNSYYDSLNAIKKVEASKAEVEAANVSLGLSLANMKEGNATFIDVISSQNLKVQANINLIKHMIEYNKAQTNLLFDMGIISPKNVLKNYKTKSYYD